MASGLGGFIHYDGLTFTTYNESNGLQSNIVRSITIDNFNNKWIGTAKGVSVFDNTNTVSATHTIMLVLPAPDTLNPVEDIKIDAQGYPWVGIYVDYLVTEGGIATYGGSTWDDYNVSDGLVGPVVRKIEIDAADNVWIATSTGVSKLSGLATGVSSIELNSKTFDVYPNPAKNMLNIVFDENNDDEIIIYNMLGHQVYSSSNNGSSVSIDVSTWSNGVYLVKNGTQIKKLIVE